MFDRYIATFLMGSMLAATAHADSILEFQTTEFGGGKPIVGTVQVATSGSNTRLEIISVTSDEAGGMIYHGDKQEMIILDHANGNYIVINQRQIDELTTNVGAAVTRQSPDSAPARPMTINDLGSHGEVIGISCRNFEVIRGGRKVRELCVSEWDDIHGGQATANAIKAVADFFEGMRRAFAAAGGMEVFDRQQELFEHMKELDGYPLLYRDFSPSGSMRRQTILTGARAESIPPERFNPPRGYQPLDMPASGN